MHLFLIVDALRLNKKLIYCSTFERWIVTPRMQNTRITNTERESLPIKIKGKERELKADIS
ncbi:MAG TPA: hypothetical protein DHV39_11220 [Verrucomicrobiales bacterium]|nr:hypothetical protein [Verrucomicrobiales bacterium]